MRYRFRGVEITIFCLVTLAFGHSLFNLFRGDGDHLLENRKSRAAESRNPANIPDQAAPYETQCKAEERFSTHASRVRISGAYCGSEKKAQPLQSSVKHKDSGFNATILNDFENNKFSTDYIPLHEGVNPIVIEFQYPNAKNFSVNLSIEKK